MTDPDWARLRTEHPEPLVAQLEKAYRAGSVAFTPKELVDSASTVETPFSEAEALRLLLGAGDWLKQELRPCEPNPNFPDEEPEQVTVFVWQGSPRRRPDWLLLVHGMNTTGRWQEHLAFDIGLWQGRVVPTFVFKYGRIWLGVALPWRRGRLKRQLREKIRELSKEAPKRLVGAAPDVVAHSFGTWLVGHILLDEEKVPTDLKLGRVILTGSILPPDFPWGRLQEKGLVAEVLNHYGTRDPIVPLAHWTIAGSGPSGRTGFDPPRAGTPTKVINVEASFTHSQAISDQEERFNSYEGTWRPFLTNPEEEASKDLTDKPRDRRWVPSWWPLRGTLLPLVVAPLLLAVFLLGLLRLGPILASLNERFTTPLWTWVSYLALVGAGFVGLFLLDRLWSFLSARKRN